MTTKASNVIKSPSCCKSSNLTPTAQKPFNECFCEKAVEVEQKYASAVIYKFIFKPSVRKVYTK